MAIAQASKRKHKKRRAAQSIQWREASARFSLKSFRPSAVLAMSRYSLPPFQLRQILRHQMS